MFDGSDEVDLLPASRVYEDCIRRGNDRIGWQLVSTLAATGSIRSIERKTYDVTSSHGMARVPVSRFFFGNTASEPLRRGMNLTDTRLRADFAKHHRCEESSG